MFLCETLTLRTSKPGFSVKTSERGVWLHPILGTLRDLSKIGLTPRIYGPHTLPDTRHCVVFVLIFACFKCSFHQGSSRNERDPHENNYRSFTRFVFFRSRFRASRAAGISATDHTR